MPGPEAKTRAGWRAGSIAFGASFRSGHWLGGSASSSQSCRRKKGLYSHEAATGSCAAQKGARRGKVLRPEVYICLSARSTACREPWPKHRIRQLQQIGGDSSRPQTSSIFHLKRV